MYNFRNIIRCVSISPAFYFPFRFSIGSLISNLVEWRKGNRNQKPPKTGKKRIRRKGLGAAATEKVESP